MKLSAAKILDFLSSLKLAVFIIIVLGILSAWGTIVESRYNAEIAQKVVYHSPYMIAAMALLVINLVAVIIDRYPWKRHHLGFILAHVGIIVLIFGSVVTKRFGIDGSMALGIGQTSRQVRIPTTDLVIWASFDGDKWTRLFEQEVDFYMNRPTPEKPVVIPVGSDAVKISDYIPFAFVERKLESSKSEQSGPALRFQLQNENVNLSQWIHLVRMTDAPAIMNLGPARIVLYNEGYKPAGENEIVLKAQPGKDYLLYEVHSQRQGGVSSRGRLAAGQAIDTGWMGLQFRALKFIPQAEEKVNFIPQQRPTELTRAAIKVSFHGEEHWLGKDSMLKFFTPEAAFIVSYGSRQLDIGFNLKLVNFKIGRYQGTRRAATYESDVFVPGVGEVNISMNEPLKHNGFTFYQASYNEDEETGQPTASILSVNRDPGRWMKYLGSLLIVLGTIVMFYFKRPFAKKRTTA